MPANGELHDVLLEENLESGSSGVVSEDDEVGGRYEGLKKVRQ